MNATSAHCLLSALIAASLALTGMASAASSGPAAGRAADTADAGSRSGERLVDGRYAVECHAESRPMTYCEWDPSKGRPKIAQHLGRKPCYRGTTWGYNNRGLWVSDQCAGVFVAE